MPHRNLLASATKLGKSADVIGYFRILSSQFEGEKTFERSPCQCTSIIIQMVILESRRVGDVSTLRSHHPWARTASSASLFLIRLRSSTSPFAVLESLVQGGFILISKIHI